MLVVFLQKREQELLELSKTVNQTRSRMDVAQSELDIYLSQHNTAVSQLNQAKDALQETVDTLRERRAAIKDLNARIPPSEEQLKKVTSNRRSSDECVTVIFCCLYPADVCVFD